MFQENKKVKRNQNMSMIMVNVKRLNSLVKKLDGKITFKKQQQ